MKRLNNKELKKEVKNIIENFQSDLLELDNLKFELGHKYTQTKDIKDKEKFDKCMKKVVLLDKVLDNLKEYYKCL